MNLESTFNKIKLLFLLWFLIFPTLSPAVIRVGTGGGGLAEMQMIYLHQNLNQFLLVCVQPENNCHLSSNQLRNYITLYRNHKVDAQKLSLAFVGENPQNALYIINENRVYIASKYLYNENAEPLELKNLLALITAIRLDLLISNEPLEHLYQQTLKVFDSLQLRHQFHRALSGQLLVIHDYTIYFSQFTTKKIFLEGESTTLDLTFRIQDQIPCGTTLQSWQFQSWKSQRAYQEVYFMAEARHICLGTDRKSTLIIQAQLDPKGQIKENTIQANFHY